MKTFVRALLGLIGVLALTLASAVFGVASASAGIPFADANSKGYIGFCDQSGKQVMSGKVGAAPFAWTAVSSIAVPDGYGSPGGYAVLDVYQPRKDTLPGDWSGKQMTAASSFTSSAHPMAQATGRDAALIDFVSVYPANWDGLVQFRMYFTAPGRPQHSIPYPSTVVKVSGGNWAVQTPGTVDCSAGTASSVEAVSLPSQILNAPTDRSTPGKNGAPRVNATSPTTAAAQSSSTAGGASTSATGSDVASGLVDASSAKKDSDDSSVGLVMIAIAAVAVLAAAGALLYRRRRGRPSAG